MIHKALEHLTAGLNHYLRFQFDLAEECATLSNIATMDGSQGVRTETRIMVTLVNIERETAMGTPLQQPIAAGKNALVSFPPVLVNLFVLFSASCGEKNYIEALKSISYTMAYFQKNPFFDRHNSPDLHNGISKLSMEIVSLDFKDLNSLWSVLGGKYLPSVLYKIRMVTIDEAAIRAVLQPLRESGASARPL